MNMDGSHLKQKGSTQNYAASNKSDSAKCPELEHVIRNITKSK